MNRDAGAWHRVVYLVRDAAEQQTAEITESATSDYDAVRLAFLRRRRDLSCRITTAQFSRHFSGQPPLGDLARRVNKRTARFLDLLVSGMNHD